MDMDVDMKKGGFDRRSPSFVEALRERAEDIRKSLGLEDKIRLKEIRDTLLRLGAEKERGEGDLAFIYPFRLTEVITTDVWEIGRVYVDPAAYTGNRPAPVMDIYRAVDVIAELLDCHRVMATAFLLCDIPVHREVFVVIIEGSRMEIWIDHPEVSPEAVRKLYSLVRNSLIREMREVQGKWARPRASTRRIIALGKFVIEHETLSWEERLHKWNAEHPDWEYKNVNSITAAHSRLKNRMRRGVGLVRQWFKDRSDI